MLRNSVLICFALAAMCTRPAASFLASPAAVGAFASVYKGGNSNACAFKNSVSGKNGKHRIYGVRSRNPRTKSLRLEQAGSSLPTEQFRPLNTRRNSKAAMSATRFGDDERHPSSVSGLTGPTQAMMWLGVVIAGGLVSASPALSEFGLAGLGSSLKGNLDLGVDLAAVENAISLASDLSVKFVSDAAREYHAQRVATLQVPDLGGLFLTAQAWAMNAKDSVVGNVDTQVLQKMPSTAEWQQSFDFEGLKATTTSKWQGLTAAAASGMDEIRASRSQMQATLASVASGDYVRSAVQSVEEPLARGQQLWNDEVAALPQLADTWKSGLTKDWETFSSTAMPAYGRDLEEQFSALSAKVSTIRLEMPSMTLDDAWSQAKASMNVPEITMPDFKIPDMPALDVVSKIELPQFSAPAAVDTASVEQSVMGMQDSVSTGPTAVSKMIDTARESSSATLSTVTTSTGAAVANSFASQSDQLDRLTEALLRQN